jgi:hypothetical protein
MEKDEVRDKLVAYFLEIDPKLDLSKVTTLKLVEDLIEDNRQMNQEILNMQTRRHDAS